MAACKIRLTALPHRPSTNIALAVSLEDGFEGVLAKHNGKKRRKKHRYQCRKFEEAGGYRIVTAQTVAETERLFSAYVEMKAIWFQKNKLRDVFADDEVRAFLQAPVLPRRWNRKSRPITWKPWRSGGFCGPLLDPVALTAGSSANSAASRGRSDPSSAPASS